MADAASTLRPSSPPPGHVPRPSHVLVQGRVVSGHLDALEAVRDAATAQGALKAQMLAVSGAFHTPLMEPAREALTQVRWGNWGAWWVRGIEVR